jgi:integrase
MVNGKRHSEDYRAAETGKKKLQSELQKAIDDFKGRIEKGALKSGDINEKSTFAQAAEWFAGMRKLEARESTQISDSFLLGHYLLPRLGSCKLKEITSPMLTKLFAELLEKGGGGGKPAYAAKPEFIQLMNGKKPPRADGGFSLVARELGIERHTFLHVRRGGNCEKAAAEKAAGYFGVPLSRAFDKKAEFKPLSASFVGKIACTLSALFTACVKNGILSQNPVKNATKPRIGEKDAPAHLDNKQIPVFFDALYRLEMDDSVRVALELMLRLGLRSGEARGLRWIDVDFSKRLASIEKNCGVTPKGLALTELKTRRSYRKLKMPPELTSILLRHKKRQSEYALSLGPLWQGAGVVCPNTTGGLMVGAIPNRAIKGIMDARPELPRGLHAHSLRHSFVSLLISNGEDPVRVAAIAGDTPEIILKHYAHSFAELEASAMDAIGSAFAGMAPLRPTSGDD